MSNQVILQFLTSILLGLEYVGNPQLLMGALIREEAGAGTGVSTLLSDLWRSPEEVNFLNSEKGTRRQKERHGPRRGRIRP